MPEFERHLELLKRGGWMMRKEAATAMAEFGKKAIPHLIEAIEDIHPQVSHQAALALGKVGDKKSASAMMEILNKEKEERWHVPGNAIWALKKMREKGVPHLINALEHKDPEVRQEVAQALADLKAEEAVDPLIERLKHDEKGVRFWIVDSLCKIGGEKAVDAAIEALKDRSPLVRECAADALGRTGSKAAVPHLIKRLRSKRYNMRENAIKSLGRIGDDRAVPHLIDSMKNEVGRVRVDAAKALGGIGGEEAIKALILAHSEIKDENMKKAIEEALKKIQKMK